MIGIKKQMKLNFMRTVKPDGFYSIIHGNCSSGIEPLYITKNRFSLTDEDRLEKINIITIKNFLRKYKLNKLNMKEETYKIDQYVDYYWKFEKNGWLENTLKDTTPTSDEDVLENMDIKVIEKFLRKKKMERISS